MPMFRKRPVMIEARQYDGSEASRDDIFIWLDENGECASAVRTITDGQESWTLAIGTPKGDALADPGDWIVQDVDGEFYPCKPDIFAATYEPA